MFQKAITAILARSAVWAVLVISALAQAQSSWGQQAGLTNPSFEEPRGKEGGFVMAPAMPGWKTTDTVFEIWSTGFGGFEAHEGTQFVELNARLDGTLYQDSTGTQPGSVLEFTFAHRGRNGEDTMKLTITDLGADNSLDGGDDKVLFTKEYTTGKDAWKVYDSTQEPPILALGNTVRFAYTAVAGTGGKGPDKTEGNFLDAANFGVGVVAMQQAAIGIKAGSWEIHQGGPPVAFETSDNAGMVSALDNAKIPPQDDAEWKRTSDATINIHEKSAITNKDKTTVDYTFFQVIVTVPEGANITTFQVNFDQVDDAARVWIFNSKHPEGAYFPKADVLAGGQNVTVAADFKAEVTEGENRIVITQYDNYPVLNTIKGIHILVDGQEVKPPTLSTAGGTETNKLGMEFKLIPAGTFLMGSPESEEGRDDDERLHVVTITRDYYMGIAEVTQSQWQQVMGTTPWKGQEHVEEGNDHAASYISWNDAAEFCRKLSELEGRTYRLPTEAEWEYACRAGSTTTYSFGDDVSQLEQYAWYFESEPDHPSQVKQKSPNRFGLYDMHGNAWEHCRDWYSSSYSASARAQSSSDQQAGLTNHGFEEPRVEEGTFVLVDVLVETMPGWKTTDTHFEIWGTGFKGVPAHEGTQFVELNAYIDGTLYQDSTGIQQGSLLEFTFAHRGRNGDDAMKLTITDLGGDNSLGGGDDTVLFTKEYTTGNDAWAVYTSTTEQQIKALGNTVRFAYGAVSSSTGELGEGNLLDAANFGIGVVSIPQESITDPTGPSEGTQRVTRGGSYATKAPNVRSATRMVATDLAKPEKTSGLRVVMVPATATVAMVTAGDSETNQSDAGEHIVTRDLENQKGAVWTEHKIDFQENFRISAEIYLGTKDDGADGLALVFQGEGNHIVSDGKGLGYEGISPSVSIEFDTYENRDECNDPVEDHVGLRADGNPMHVPSDFVEVGNLEDGEYHPITFEWNASQQTFNLSLDGTQIFKERSFPENGLAGQQVYFGFTASTGLYSNEHKVRSISFSIR